MKIKNTIKSDKDYSRVFNLPKDHLDVNKNYCRDCESEIPTDDVEHGDIVSCPSCGCEYEVNIKDGVISLLDLNMESEDWGE